MASPEPEPAKLRCPVCGRLANPLFDGICLPCWVLQEDLDRARCKPGKMPIEWGPQDEVGLA